MKCQILCVISIKVHCELKCAGGKGGKNLLVDKLKTKDSHV